MPIFEELAKSVVNGDVERVRELTRQAITAGEDPLEVINNGLIVGMNIVGPRFKAGEMFIPEVLMCARAMQAGMELLKPLLVGQDVPVIGKVVLGTVKDDLHDIGKNLVAMMLESSGFTVINLGVNISPEQFVEATKENQPDIVGMSALLTTTMEMMRNTIEALKEANLREQVKVIIGGAPVSQEFAYEIGADGYAPDAASAVELCKKLLGK
ncbi:MAG: corrinoid protein [Firmicutes bacterium]|nr:corrinoid protein [Bacillota bacterium]